MDVSNGLRLAAQGIRDSRVDNARSASIKQPTYSPRQSPKSLSGEEVGSEIWVDAGSETFSSRRAAGFIGFQNVEGGVADDALGDLLLRSHRVDRDDRALEVKACPTAPESP